jgi:signal transduction histidine kinase
MTGKVYSVLIRTEEDVVSARHQAREIAASLGYDVNDQTRIATAVSEIARNAFRYANGGAVEFEVDAAQSMYVIRVADAGPGIDNLEEILGGTYQSKTGMGMGIVGARRLVDDFGIETTPGKGTVIQMRKRLPARATKMTPQRVSRIAAEQAKTAPRSVLDELRHENQELVRVLEELRSRQEDLHRVNAELEDTNRGVLALYAELDERAERLRRADATKSRFLSHMSHEFRTPLSSILALSRLLMDESDGKLNTEQHKQVHFIRKSAESLLEMVNDLLDLARVEAGKTVVRPVKFQVSNLFGALRGVLRPIQVNEGVQLMFEDPVGLPTMYTDESKIAQILRNFVSNALKFTERGEVRVSAAASANDKLVTFTVRDTGIGINAKDLPLIFQEFTQIDSPIQSKYKGTGLGLPLSKALAELLGGRVRVESAEGTGSTFSAEIPTVYEGQESHEAQISGAEAACDLLVVDDEEVTRYLIRQCMGPGGILEASTGRLGVELAAKHQPRAILLDVRMPGMSGFDVLRELKSTPATGHIRIVVITSKPLTQDERDLLQSYDVPLLGKDVLSRPDAKEQIRMAIDGKMRIEARQTIPAQ